MTPQKTLIVFALVLPNAMFLRAQNQVSLTVDATMSIFRADGNNDGNNGTAPIGFDFAARRGQTLTFPSVSGGWTCQDGYPDYSADGETSGYCLSAGQPTNFKSVDRLSGYQTTDFVGALTGVFLEDGLPASAPDALRFYVANNSAGGIQTDFKTLRPKIGQVFFIGDGLTGTDVDELQMLHVPPTATRLYLGYVDNCMPPGNTVPGCYTDNVGSVTVTLRLQDHVPDWVQPTLTSAPSPRIGAAMAYDSATHSTVLFGGSTAFAPGISYGDTWIWRHGWTMVTPPASPSPRGSAGMAYDRATGTLVLFGGEDSGQNGAVFGDTWTWDGLTWKQQFPPVSPPARTARGAMVYDGATETVLLFGGTGADNGDYGGVPFGDTWEWNGRTQTWTQMFPSFSPSPRAAPLAHDPLTKTVVLFGGDNGGGDCCRVYYNDTWTWDGADWTRQSPALSPSPRTAAPMAYDESLGKVVVFGGTSGPPQALNDTWAWDGTTWNQLTPHNQPSARYVSSMDFDPLSDGLLLFGGELAGDIVTSNTWLLTPVPVP